MKGGVIMDGQCIGLVAPEQWVRNDWVKTWRRRHFYRGWG